jgi:hypothetical protein
VLAGILNSGAADALIAGLIPLLDEGAAQAIANGVNTDAAQPAAQSMIRSLIMASDAEVMADAINSNPDFVAGMLKNLSETAAAAIADGMNANPATATTVARYLDGTTSRRIAEALNANTAIIRPLIQNLSPQVGRAIAEGLNQNTTDMTSQLMGALSDQVGIELAGGLADNPELITTLLPRLDANTAHEVAMGLNENAAPGGGGFLQAMVEGTSPELTQVIVNTLNTAPYNMDAFLSTLIQNLNADTAAAVAHGLGGNPALVENVLNHLDGTVMAGGLNANEAWLTALVGELDAGALAGALNSALGTAGGQSFVTGLLSTLDGGIVAEALNANPGLTRELMNAGGSIGLGSTLHDLLADAGAGAPGGFLTELIGGLNGTMMARVLENAASGATLTAAERARLPFQSVDGNGYTMLKVTWFYVFLQADTFLGLQRGWAWSNIEGAEPYHWSGSAVVPP